jgi:hypothetical protein
MSIAAKAPIIKVDHGIVLKSRQTQAFPKSALVEIGKSFPDANFSATLALIKLVLFSFTKLKRRS